MGRYGHAGKGRSCEVGAMNSESKKVDRYEILAEKIAAEHHAFSIAWSHAEKTDYSKTAGNQNRALDWFKSLEEFLDAYRNANHQSFSDEDVILGRLQGLVRAFAVGKIPDVVKLAAQKDGNPWWPKEREDIAMAIYYVEAAKSGAIQNTAYNKFIRDHFGVQPQTVRRWVKDKDRICEGISAPASSVLERDILKRGERYKSWRSGRKGAPY